VNPDSDPIRIRSFDDKAKIEEINTAATSFLIKKIAVFLSLGLKDAQATGEALIHHLDLLTFFYFCFSFLPSWIRIRICNPDTDPGPYPSLRFINFFLFLFFIFALLDPDPDLQSRYGSRGPH
jgi:hypothetical protein